MLAKLNEQAHGRITILPGGGLTPQNAATVLSMTGCRELHGSLRDETPGNPTSPHLVQLTIKAMNSI